MKHVQLGLIGAGNMGMAIVQGAVTKQILSANEIGIIDHHQHNLEKGRQLGFTLFEDEMQCAEHCSMLMLAIKPQGFEELLSNLKAMKNQPVFISIAAGISIDYIQRFFPQAKVIRVMPNTPLMIGEGATALCRSESVSDDEFNTIQDLFSGLGKCCEIKEDKMNAIIAVSGSTPAYVYYFIECLARDAQTQGIDYDLALMLAAQTFVGAAKLLLQDGRSAEELIDMVCSKGGATIQAMHVLQSRKINEILHEANVAAIKRAEELGK